MSRSVSADYEALRELESDAERRCKRALFILQNKWGKGEINVGELVAILRGDNERG